MTQVELDIVAAGGCAVPGCPCRGKPDPKGFYVNQHCHEGASLEARYLKGVLYLECSECERVVAEIEVKES